MHPARPRSKGRWVIAGQPSSFRFAPTQLSAMHPHTRQRHLTGLCTVFRGSLRRLKSISAIPMQTFIVWLLVGIHRVVEKVLLTRVFLIFLELVAEFAD